MRVITFGTFDVFHIGHVNILERAKELGEYLIVGVSTDALSFRKKKRYPVYNEQSRAQIVNAIHCVNEVFFEESMELKRDYITMYSADILVMGDDWEGRFDEFKDVCDVVYLPRTKDISTTEIIKTVREEIE
jgi:glycerol-3-phosphate cytidylyltransferase